MRKFVLAAVAAVVSTGLTLSAEMLFVKFDKEKKEITVKEKKNSPETVYKVSDKTVFKMGDDSVPADKALARLEKMKEGKGKLDITGTDGAATEIKFAMPKKKQ